MVYSPDGGAGPPYQEAGTFGRPPSGPYQDRGYGQERTHDPYGIAAPLSEAGRGGDGTGSSGPARRDSTLGRERGPVDASDWGLHRRVPSPYAAAGGGVSSSPSQASPFPHSECDPAGAAPSPASFSFGGGDSSSSRAHFTPASMAAPAATFPTTRGTIESLDCRVIASEHSQYTNLAVSACTVLATEACLMMFREPPSEALLESILKV